MTESLAKAVNETWWTMPERLATHIPDREACQFGNVRASFGALPSSAGNRIFVFEPPTREDLEAAVAWYADRNVSFKVTVTAPVAAEIADDLNSLDLVKTRESPGMALPSLDSVPPIESTATVSEVNDPEDRDDFCSVFVDAFESSRDFPEQVSSQAVLADESFTHLVARQDRKPVACGILLKSSEAAGVFSVGVPPDFRRQGLGETMTRAVLRSGRDDGCTIGVLDSSEMGQPLYEQMGFETVITYHHFEPAT